MVVVFDAAREATIEMDDEGEATMEMDDRGRAAIEMDNEGSQLHTMAVFSKWEAGSIYPISKVIRGSPPSNTCHWAHV
ncbi:hypothetical protein ACOSQ3_027094 [Xanthoceras sorbifolium]